MTNFEIYNLNGILNELSQHDDIKLPAKVNFKLIKNKKMLEPFVASIEETRQKIILEFAELNENNEYIVPEDKIEEANNKLKEIFDVDNANIYLEHVSINDIQESVPYSLIEGLMPILDEE